MKAKSRLLPMLAVLGLATCARVSQGVREAPTAPPPLEPLAALEKLEHERPRDPQLKLKLARRHACDGRVGVAIEHWLWVRQFAPGSPEAGEAQRLYAQSEDPPALAKSLACP